MFYKADEASKKLATSLAQEKGSRESIEAKLKILEGRTAELEAENRRLLQSDSANKALLQDQKSMIERYKGQLAEQNGALSSYKGGNKKAAASAEDVTIHSSKDIQEYLNHISNPKLSKQVRTAWKNETIAQFADGSVKVVDESDGTLKQYSASIFLNLLINVPHRITVKDIKRDRNNRITELRLSTQSSL